MLKERLEQLNLPSILVFNDGKKLLKKENWEKRKTEIKELLCSEEYGFMPPPPLDIKYEILSHEKNFCAGKADLFKVSITVFMEKGSFAFPIYCVIPKKSRPCPAFLHIGFRDLIPDKYLPSEEICDNGFAVITVCYNDITIDNGDFSDGLANIIINNEHNYSSPGKIALWSWAASRVMDYIQTMDCIDPKNVAVVGHSRLGKTALLTGALDERFAFSISNNSGCSGAALSRGNTGETISDIYGRFPFWFCNNYKKYVNKEETLPFDQHFLLSLTAPRNVYVSSAKEDLWADPEAEYLSCAAAGEVYEFLGEKGFICPDRFPCENEFFHEGKIGYHIREGTHYLSRYDWLKFMEFIIKHKNL